MLSVANVHFGYQFRKILSGVSFRVEPGETVQLVGPNGAGKTTLMAIIAGLIAENSGSVSFHADGEAHTDYREYCEYLPAEANALFLKLDALTNLSLWSRLRGREPSEATLVAELTRWGLGSPLVHRQFPVEKFSTGMKRRLALARVGLSGAPLWLLDEPLYGLDKNGIAVFQAMLTTHLAARGMVVIVSHDTAPLEPFVVRSVAIGSQSA